jgi:CHRD domain-containing protein
MLPERFPGIQHVNAASWARTVPGRFISSTHGRNIIMKCFNVGTIRALAVIACFAMPSIASAELFIARLNGAEEVPAVSTGASGQFAFSFASLTPVAGQNAYSLSYRLLVGNVAQAHIHIGQPGVAGGISIWLCETAAAPAPAAVAALTPTCPGTTLGAVSGTITAAQVIGPVGQLIAAGQFAEVIDAIRSGLAYVNVHTTSVPGGEIRGVIR